MWKLGTSAIVLALAATPAHGQELIFGANVGARWDSNVNNVPNGTSDFSARVGPEVHLLKEQGDLTYDLQYVPTYQAYSRFASLDDWDQLVRSTVTFQLGPTTSLQVRDIFDYAPIASNFLEQLTTGAGVPLGNQVINTIGRYTLLVNTASIDLKHQWSELWSGEAIVTNFYQDPKVQNAVTSTNTSAQGNVTYAVTERDRIGGGLGFTATQYGSNSFQNASSSYFYNVSGIWNHDFSPTWTLNVQAGPTLADNGSVSTPPSTAVAQFPNVPLGGSFALLYDFKGCPPVVGLQNGRSLLNLCSFPTLLANSATTPSITQANSTVTVPLQGISQGSQTSLTYFANINMSKHWETITATLGYSRSAGNSGLFASSTEIDTVSGSVLWNVSPVWQTNLTVLWSDQSSSSDHVASFREIVQPFPSTEFNTSIAQAAGVLVQEQKNTINVYQWIVGLHSEYRFTKRLSIFGNCYFFNQTSKEQGGAGLNLSSLNYNASRFDLGFHYEFDPIHL